MYLFPLIFLIFSLLVMIDFLRYIFTGKHFLTGTLFRTTEIFTVIINPYLGLSILDMGEKNDCCTDSAAFSPDHRITIYALIVICILGYFYLSYRKKMSSPVIEVLFNSVIVIGLILNIFVAIQFNELIFWFLGHIPIIILFLYSLIKNHQIWQRSNANMKSNYENKLELFCWQLLNWKFLQKAPIFMVICLPVLLICISILMLFGQRPDSLILAFTDTYKHGFSQLDCSNVVCPDGHFLCTIAASGHTGLVKPVRNGVRHGHGIKVNRQLLISNAFEDLLEERLPYLHRPIRMTYNIIGGNFAKLYSMLSNKWISDIIYLLMKPFEWIFLVILYTSDNNPENRIAKQYLHTAHRKTIDEIIFAGEKCNGNK